MFLDIFIFLLYSTLIWISGVTEKEDIFMIIISISCNHCRLQDIGGQAAQYMGLKQLNNWPNHTTLFIHCNITV